MAARLIRMDLEGRPLAEKWSRVNTIPVGTYLLGYTGRPDEGLTDLVPVDSEKLGSENRLAYLSGSVRSATGVMGASRSAELHSSVR